MKLTILGSGTVVPNGLRNSAGYFVELPDARVMMDCGAGTVHALARYNCPWERMTHLFVSHFHVDHIGELASLFFAFRYGMKQERSEPLTIIGTATNSWQPKIWRGPEPIAACWLMKGSFQRMTDRQSWTV